jgi:hypothetical protein
MDGRSPGPQNEKPDGRLRIQRQNGAAERVRECNLVYCRAACRDYPVCQAGICICLLRVWAKSLAQQRLQIGEGTREPLCREGMDGGGSDGGAGGGADRWAAP